MWLLTAKAQNFIADQQDEPVYSDPPYWPVGQPDFIQGGPTGSPDKGGIGSVNDRYSIILTGYEDNPPYVEDYTRHIGTSFPGLNGRIMEATYEPYDKTVGVYTQPSQRSVPEWQQQEYPLFNRSQLRQMPIGSVNFLDKADPDRPPVFSTDYSTPSITSDANMVYTISDIGYTGTDWNAY